MGQDFSKADKGKTFKRGGDMATKGVNPFAKFEKSGKDVEKKGMKEGSKADMALDKKQMMGMKKGGMAGGGMPMKDGKPAFIGDGKGAMKKGGAVKKMMGGGMAKGGSASSRADGVAQRGKTVGKLFKKGGMAC